MPNIKRDIQKQYGIDIDEDKLLVMYKISKNPDISEEDLEEAIEKTRRRWEKSVQNNNQPEEVTQKAKRNLENADKYEEIIRDADLRRQMFEYYGKNAGDVKGIKFAEDYFSLISTSKKIRQSDIDFFFTYYENCNRDVRKGKDGINEMLKKEYGLAETKWEKEESELKDTSSDKRIHNMFSKETILAVRRALDEYAEAVKAVNINGNTLPGTLYDYIELDNQKTLNDLLLFVTDKNDELYKKAYDSRDVDDALRNPLNAILGIGKRKDVIDNFPEFKMLIKYPELTPYMYAITEPSKETLDKISGIACDTYEFVNTGDFIISYYDKIADNFNINNAKINGVIRRAKKNAGANKILGAIKGRMSGRARILYFIAYYPIFILYLACEIFKILFSSLAVMKIPLFLAALAGWIWLILTVVESETGVFPDLLDRNTWWALVDTFSANDIVNGKTLMYAMLQTAIAMGLVVIAPAAFAAKIVATFFTMFNKNFDFVGLERTISEGIFKRVKKNIEEQEKLDKDAGVKLLIPRATGTIVNTAVAAVLITAIIERF